MQRETDAYFLNASNDAGPLRPAGGGDLRRQPRSGVSGPTANPVNAWTHVALTYDGTTLRLYVNGAQVASQAATGAHPGHRQPAVDRRQQPLRRVLPGPDRRGPRLQPRAHPGRDPGRHEHAPIVPPAPRHDAAVGADRR